MAISLYDVDKPDMTADETQITRRQHLARLVASFETQKDFCEMVDIASTIISGILSEKRNMGEKMRRKIEDALGLTPGYMDMPIDQIKKGTPHIAELPEGFISVPESNIRFACGDGVEYVPVEDAEPAIYRLSWLHKMRLNPANLKRFDIQGDSMAPLLIHDDTVLVDISDTSVQDGKVYAIRYDNDLRIKRLFKRLDGTLILRSDNPSYKDEEVAPDLVAEHIAVIGRVREKSGTGGL